jgi:hypothetical protein
VAWNYLAQTGPSGRILWTRQWNLVLHKAPKGL